MASALRHFARDVSPYLILLISLSTLGPLQFGFHLVWGAPRKVLQTHVRLVADIVHAG